MLLFSEAFGFQVSHSDLISVLHLYLRIMNDVCQVRGSRIPDKNGSTPIAVEDMMNRIQF